MKYGTRSCLWQDHQPYSSSPVILIFLKDFPFPLSEGLWFSSLQSYMLRISLEEGEILSVDRNLLDLLNYPEQSWHTCQLASFLCIADIPCLLSCLMRLQKRRHLIRSSGAGAVDPGQNVVEKKVEEERPLEDSPPKELMSERCMFRLRWAWKGILLGSYSSPCGVLHSDLNS